MCVTKLTSYDYFIPLHGVRRNWKCVRIFINIVCFFGNTAFALKMQGFLEIACETFEVVQESNMAA